MAKYSKSTARPWNAKQEEQVRKAFLKKNGDELKDRWGKDLGKGNQVMAATDFLADFAAAMNAARAARTGISSAFELSEHGRQFLRRLVHLEFAADRGSRELEWNRAVKEATAADIKAAWDVYLRDQVHSRYQELEEVLYEDLADELVEDHLLRDEDD